MSIRTNRTPLILKPDQSRVLLRHFNPGDSERAGRIIGRIMSIPDERVGPLLEEISAEFSRRHRDIPKVFLERFEQVSMTLLTDPEVSEQRRQLIGSYFLAEYSLESAALFNPSIVADPDQSSLPQGALRFILSLRATGEGHVSSITFRSGILHADHRIEVAQPTGFLTEPRQFPNPIYEKGLFARKLIELGYFVSISDSDRAPGLNYLATVYNGIDLTLYPFQGAPGEDLIFLGRIHPDKGVHLAIAVARLSGMPLIIAGIVQDKEYFRKQVEPYLNYQIRYVGALDVEGKNDLFARASANRSCQNEKL